jgi:Beta-lactamase enzyme family
LPPSARTEPPHRRAAWPSRALLAATLAFILCHAAPAAAHWKPHLRSAVRYAQSRAGHISFEVRNGARKWGLHSKRVVRSASVVKAMLLVAYLNQGSVRHRRLRDEDRELIDPMIERSDNDAASRVFTLVGTGRLLRVARRAHMRRFAVGPGGFWGGSQIDADDQARFFLHIDQLVVPKHRWAALHLLSSITPEQRWGVGRVRLPPGWKLYFKGGWGSGTGAVDHQIALLTCGTQRVSVAVLTTDDPSHEYGKETLRGIFARLLHTLPSPG